MSYILDALRKADAERERGAVPGLNAQALPPVSGELEPARASARLPWVVAGVALLLLAVLGWVMLSRDAPPPMPPVAVIAAAPVVPAAVAPEPLPAAAPPLRAAATRRPAEATPDAPAQPGASSPAARPAGDARIVPLRELPDEIRRQIPALAVGGSMYSKDAASRMLIVNGLVLKEGDDAAPGLKLEQIRLKSAVLRFREQRFEISW